MNTEERLHKLERLTKFQMARINATDMVLGALVSTHPNPQAAAKEIRRVAELGLVQHLNDELVTDETRDLIQHRLGEFAWIADQQTKAKG
jgi:hypothetical protein